MKRQIKHHILRAFTATFLFLFSLIGLAQDNSALIIIDMQPYFAERGGDIAIGDNPTKLQKILAEQAKAIEEAKKADIPIVFVEYELDFWRKDEEDSMAKGTSLYTPASWVTVKNLTDAVKDYDKTITVMKKTDSMFATDTTNQQLTDFFKDHEVKNLIITGANGGACVWSSIYDAVETDVYNVYPYSKGIADFNYNNFIYPYDDRYTDFRSSDTCIFNELDYMKDVIAIMNNGKNSKEKSQMDSERTDTQIIARDSISTPNSVPSQIIRTGSVQM